MNSAEKRDPESASQTALMRIIAGATAIAFASVLGSAACIDHTQAQGLVFRWRWVALFWSLGGALAGWGLWQAVWAADAAQTPQARRRLILVLATLALGGFAVFIFPIIFVPAGQFREVITGLLAAVLVLSFVGWIIFQLGKLFSSENGSDNSAPPGKK